jgi:hypothetical protein
MHIKKIYSICSISAKYILLYKFYYLVGSFPEGVYEMKEFNYPREGYDYEESGDNSNNDDFYSGNEIANLLEDDEISSEEEGFMRGYMEM